MISSHRQTAILVAFIWGIFLAQANWNWTDVTAFTLLLSLATAITLATLKRLQPHLVLTTAGLMLPVMLLSWGYFQLRLPTPSDHDVSYLLGTDNYQRVVLEGQVVNEPRQLPPKPDEEPRVKFFLKAELASSSQRRTKGQPRPQPTPVRGKVYTTIPSTTGSSLVPGQSVKLLGILYHPSPPENPDQFSFKNYLARQGSFAGFKTYKLLHKGEPPWGFWKLRHRIVTAQDNPTLSSIVLGRKAVDLPPSSRDTFIKAGMAHVLAASGFHVSLLLGVVLAAVDRFNLTDRSKLAIGSMTLLLYVGLTGLQPSVLRAALMGLATLIALVAERRVNSRKCLLLVAAILLAFNPLWIEEVGFQLSFLATWGLLVTIPTLNRMLDWLPLNIATLFSIPIAALIWTFPISGLTFGTFPTYTVLVNALTTPLVLVVSLGGFLSAGAALISPQLGGAIAWVVSFPCSWLVSFLNWCNGLPLSSISVSLSPGSVLLIYGLYLLLWLKISNK